MVFEQQDLMSWADTIMGTRALAERRAREGARPAPRPVPERALHMHSLEAQDAGAGVLRGRKAAVLRWLREFGPATDRQVRAALFPYGDMNMVRPRISELIEEGLCHEVGSVADGETGMRVRIVRAKLEGEV